MLLCSLLAWLAVLAILLVALAMTANRLFALESLRRYARILCPWLCRIAILLALLGGLLLGIWLCLCGPRLWQTLMTIDRCALLLLVVMLLLVLALAMMLLAIASCTAFEGFAGVRRGSPISLLLILSLLLFFFILRCCGLTARMALSGDSCARLLALAALLLLLALFLGMFYRRICRDPDPRSCSRINPYLIAALVLAVIALVALFLCCDHLRHKDYDLAMLGIWWDGQFDGEQGAHLRWAFRYGLPFPPGGFDLQRRPSSGGAWVVLNGAPIRPATIFQDASPAPGPMWQNRAVDRLHPSRWTHFNGAPFTELADMVARPPYSELYFVQRPDDPTLPAPASPYTSEAALNAYLATYRAAGSPAHPARPLAQWRLEPMQTLMIAGLHPEIARMLGLLYIDRTADPNVEYDYRIVGHWTDRDRSYTVERLSRPRTAALAAPQLTQAMSPVVYNAPSGQPTREDLAVALRWVPPTPTPQISLAAVDGIRPVRYLPRVQPLGNRPCPPPPAPGPSFVPVQRRAGAALEDVAPLALTPEGEGASAVWPAFFYVDRNVSYQCYGYTLEGIDVFGRTSPLSNVLVADVRDQTGPPPPVNV